MRANRDDGRRIDIEFVDALRFGNTAVSELDQSMYSVESWLSQKSLSSSSFSNLGIFFKFFIGLLFFLIHISNRYYSYFSISNRI